MINCQLSTCLINFDSISKKNQSSGEIRISELTRFENSLYQWFKGWRNGLGLICGMKVVIFYPAHHTRIHLWGKIIGTITVKRATFFHLRVRRFRKTNGSLSSMHKLHNDVIYVSTDEL